jgi:hypothetical protein
MQSNRDLTSEEAEDLDLYIDLSDLMIDVIDSDRSEATLDSNEIELLEDIAYSNDRMVAGIAKNILEVFYGYDFDLIINPRSYSRGDVTNFKYPQIPTKVSPNPVLDYCKISFPVGNYTIKFYSQNGQMMKENNCEDCSEYFLNTSNLVPGIYLYTIYSSSKIGSGKIFIR